jgi:long-chain fatty acid transport protein
MAMRRFITCLICTLAATTANAQGLSVHSLSACALGRSAGGVADPCADGSAIFYNPAAIITQPGIAGAGVLAIHTASSFTYDVGGSWDGTQPIQFPPHVWIAGRITPAIAMGIGAAVPYGLTTEWPLDFEGRFTGYDNTLRAIYIQPTIAVQVMNGRLALGLGFDVVNGMVEIRRRVDLARTNIPNSDLQFSAVGVPDGTDFADARLAADTWATTFHAGLLYRPSQRWALGIRYLHSAELDLIGDAQFEQVTTGLLLPPGNPLGVPAGTPIDVVLASQFGSGAPLGDQSLATIIELPNQFVAGIRFSATSSLKLLLDYQWTGWETFDYAALDFANAPADTLYLDFHNASTFRFAAELVPRVGFTIRSGVMYSEEATPDIATPLLPEARRVSFAGGLGYNVTKRLRADGGFEVVLQGDRRGGVRPRESREQVAAELKVGTYSANAITGALTLAYALGRQPAIRAARD